MILLNYEAMADFTVELVMKYQRLNIINVIEL